MSTFEPAGSLTFVTLIVVVELGARGSGKGSGSGSGTEGGDGDDFVNLGDNSIEVEVAVVERAESLEEEVAEDREEKGGSERS